MAAVCPTCGLPDELCVCEEMAKSAQPVTIEIEERRYGKEVTIVKGLDNRDIDLKRLASELKSSLACGGTTHEDAIELQGNHRDRIDAVLAENGLEVR
jgi:translation initiation factor 1